MSRKRVVFAVLSAVLLALVIAVPVIAATYGKPAESGYVRMYNYVDSDEDCTWEATGTSTVRLTFDAMVDDYSIAMCVAGTRLKPKTEYALVNVTDFRNHPGGPYWVDVTILGTAFTNKLGALSLKASATAPLSDSWNDESGVWARFSGADVWLVPRALVLDYEGNKYIDIQVTESEHCPIPDPCIIYASLGLPTDWEDVFEPYEFEESGS